MVLLFSRQAKINTPVWNPGDNCNTIWPSEGILAEVSELRMMSLMMKTALTPATTEAS